MHLIYIDDSRDPHKCAFSALAIPVYNWLACFQRAKQFRTDLKRSDGIYPHKELHAWKFVSGRGDIADRIVGRARRCEIFAEALEMTADLPGALLFNAVFGANQEVWAFERLLNRINRTMKANAKDPEGVIRP